MKWISVKDRLPDENVFEVLVKVDEPSWGSTEPKMIVAYYAHDLREWRCDLTAREIYHVTHWMPLPEPPKI